MVLPAPTGPVKSNTLLGSVPASTKCEIPGIRIELKATILTYELILISCCNAVIDSNFQLLNLLLLLHVLALIFHPKFALSVTEPRFPRVIVFQKISDATKLNVERLIGFAPREFVVNEMSAKNPGR